MTMTISRAAMDALLIRAYEVVHHFADCQAIGGNGDDDCTCDAVPFLRDLKAILDRCTVVDQQPTSAIPAAWLHTVTQGDGSETDSALSFLPDNFPLSGELGFRSLGAVPLYLATPARDEAQAVRNDRWITQTKFYDPTKPPTVCTGNCTEAAFASILGLRLDDVPSFTGLDSADYWIALEQFVRSKGFELYSLEGERVFDALYLADGPSERGCGHFVVMQNGMLAHDPHPSRAGLVSIKNTWVLIPHDPIAISYKPAASAESQNPNHAECCAIAGGNPALCDCVNPRLVSIPTQQLASTPALREVTTEDAREASNVRRAVIYSLPCIEGGYKDHDELELAAMIVALESFRARLSTAQGVPEMTFARALSMCRDAGFPSTADAFERIVNAIAAATEAP